MLKAGLKAIGSISKASKTKNALDVVKAAGDTVKAVKRVTQKKKKSTEKR
jgi:hypothetical protein